MGCSQALPLTAYMASHCYADLRQQLADAQDDHDDDDDDEHSPSKRRKTHEDASPSTTAHRNLQIKLARLKELDAYFEMGSSYGKPSSLLLLQLVEAFKPLTNRELW